MGLVTVGQRREVGPEDGVAQAVLDVLADGDALEALVDAGDQFLGVEGLGDIVVALQREAVQAVDLVGTVGEEEDYHALVVLPNDARHLESVEFGHVYVEQNQVGMCLAVHLEADTAVVGVDDLIALGLDEAFEEHGVAEVVIDQKYPDGLFHCGSLIVKHEPLPSVLSTDMVPPCASTSSLTYARPSPMPGCSPAEAFPR